MCFSDDDIFGIDRYIASPCASPILPEYDLPEFPQIENQPLPIPQVDLNPKPQQHRSYPISRKCPPRQEQAPEPVSPEELLEEESESDQEYEVEQVLSRKWAYDEKRNRQCLFYLLKFKGFPNEDAEWTSVFECQGCREVIRKFETERKRGDPVSTETIQARIDNAQQRIKDNKKRIQELEKDPRKNRNEICYFKRSSGRLQGLINHWKKQLNQPEPEPEPEPEPSPETLPPPPEPSQEDKKKMLIEGMKKMQEFMNQMISFLE